jgi:hypothetical protein
MAARSKGNAWHYHALQRHTRARRGDVQISEGTVRLGRATLGKARHGFAS